MVAKAKSFIFSYKAKCNKINVHLFLSYMY